MTHERADYEQMVGECFSDAICPPVPFENASAHECFEVVQSVLGKDCGPGRFSSLTATDCQALAREFGTYFECESPTSQQIDDAVRWVLARVPDETAAPKGH